MLYDAHFTMLGLICLFIVVVLLVAGGSFGVYKYRANNALKALVGTTPAAPPAPAPSSASASGGFTTVAPAAAQPAGNWAMLNNVNFIPQVKYTQSILVSDPAYITKAKNSCAANPNCYGFFAQTQLCPDPNASDMMTDPNKTPGAGCYRVIGYYNEDDPLLQPAARTAGNGNVYLKITDATRQAAITKWSGPVL